MDVGEDTKVSSRRGETLKVEPGELLEEGWFFGNLLDRKTRVMSRCFSDPCPSSKVGQEMLVGTSYEETNSPTNKVLFPGDGRARGHDREVVSTPPQLYPPRPRPSLMRTPSMPSPGRGNSSRALVQTSSNTASNSRLQHRPSLPSTDMNMNNLEDEESNYSMGRLIRQASFGQSNTLPPRQHTPKKKTGARRAHPEKETTNIETNKKQHQFC